MVINIPLLGRTGRSEPVEILSKNSYIVLMIITGNGTVQKQTGQGNISRRTVPTKGSHFPINIWELLCEGL